MEDTRPTPRILLYGNSILIEGLASKLKLKDGWAVKRTEHGEVRDVSSVDYIVVDLCDLTTAQALPMLSALPRIILIGMDPIADTLTVLTGRTRPLGSAQIVLNALKGAI
ncbi:MAG: hypothetical protein NTW32_21480 [Chloroflexi bacterium]|nr:hypothetical protein [Chloroflexota bacterium]